MSELKILQQAVKRDDAVSTQETKATITVSGLPTWEENRNLLLSMLPAEAREAADKAIIAAKDAAAKSGSEKTAAVMETCICCVGNHSYWCPCSGGTCWYYGVGCPA